MLKNLKQPRTADQIIEPLTQEEIGRLFSAVNPNTFLGSRNTALISLMLDTGLRLSEVADLKEPDIHVEGQYVKVMGKGSKERLVSFGKSCQRALLDYLHHFRVAPADEGVDSFFVTIDGYSMTPTAIQSLMKRLARSSGLARLYPHLLRHTYATMFLLNGGDIFLLKQNLGHSTLSMVEQYLHVASSVAAVRSQGFSPLDRLDVKDGRRFRHSLKRGNGLNTRIYPHAGVNDSSRRGRWASVKGRAPSSSS